MLASRFFAAVRHCCAVQASCSLLPSLQAAAQSSLAHAQLYQSLHPAMPRQVRRSLLLVAAAAALKPLQRRAALSGLTSAALTQTLPARADELSFSKARNGLEYADAKVGSGSPFKAGQRVAVDYVMSTTGARYGSKIDATKDRNEPYSWVLGDGTTILGLAQCILIFLRITSSYRAHPTHGYIAHRSRAGHSRRRRRTTDAAGRRTTTDRSQ